MRSCTRLAFPAAVTAALFLGPDVPWARADAAETGKDVQIVSPLTSDGSVPVEATIKGIVKTRTNPALTHVGVLASDIVTLSWLDGSGIVEIRSDGTSSLFTTVPSGKALVITDIQWRGFFGTPGESRGLGLQISTGGLLAFSVYQDVARADENGNAKGSASMTTGITFGPGTVLSFSGSGGVSTLSANAHGYYVDVP